MQTPGNLVGVLVKLAAGMQHGHDHLNGRAPFFRDEVGGNAATIIRNGDRSVSVDGYADAVAVTGEGLVDGVVDGLEDHVVQAGTIIGITDVHARALAHRI